jgi:hypothetical protein
MKYKIASDLQIDYSSLEPFVPDGREITKNELLDKCTGVVSYELLQSIKELEFDRIGRDVDGTLYIV